MKYRFYDIRWDTYDDETEQAPNQTEIGLPSEVIVDWDDDEEDIADYGCDLLSDEYGFLVHGFKYEKAQGGAK